MTNGNTQYSDYSAGGAGPAALTPEVERKPYIEQSMDALEGGIDTLQELTEQMGIRLVSCLAVENESKVRELRAGSEGPKPVLSERIDSVTDKLLDVNITLRDITRRIEL